MDYDMILPAVAAVSGVFAGTAVLYTKIRLALPTRVNCWFCNQDTRVPYQQRHGWVCPNCHQYNGFTQDGDYNVDIPAQYCETLNWPVRTSHGRTRAGGGGGGLALGNGFCQTCNLNQTLKMRALADFTPLHPEHYDTEVEEYRQRLERTFCLCRQCEATLHQTLGKQDSWLKPKLMAWRLSLTQHVRTQLPSSATVVCWRGRCEAMLHLLLVLLSILLFVSNLEQLQQHSGVRVLSVLGAENEALLLSVHQYFCPLVVAGLVLLLVGAVTSEGPSFRVWEAVCGLLWGALLGLWYVQPLLPPSDYHPLQVLVCGMALLCSLVVALTARRHPGHSSGTSNPFKADVSKRQRSSSSSSGSGSPLLQDTPPCSPPQSYSPSEGSRSPLTRTPPTPQDQLVELHSTLGGLRISSSARPRPPSPLAPARLFLDKGGSPAVGQPWSKRITQASWVAGGYWGQPPSPSRPSLQAPGPQPYPLSRSSSQSSGFVSLGSVAEARATLGLASPSHSLGQEEATSVLTPASLYPSDSASQCGTHLWPHQGHVPSSPGCGSTLCGSLRGQGARTGESGSCRQFGSQLNPCWAFFLGMSIAANLFLISLYAGSIFPSQ